MSIDLKANFSSQSGNRPYELSIDTAYQHIDDATWNELLAFAKKAGISEKRNALFAGAHVNASENRAALHTALRNLSNSPVSLDGQDVMPSVKSVWKQMDALCNKLVGVTDIIHIGIGGSDFGPRLVCEALSRCNDANSNAIRVHFLANIDSAELANILSRIQPLSTRIIIASKTFTTLETMQNARAVMNWLKEKGVSESQIKKHTYAVTANTLEAEKFNIPKENIFPFWDWVGGRFSVWSAVGLIIALKFGFQTFKEFLAGAHALDQHFLNAPLAENHPLLLALTLIHNQRTFNCKSHALIPYAFALASMPHWLQQLDMESNGKRTHLNGTLTNTSSPVIFGSAGANAQHSFFQMLHQGPEVIPVDFVAVIEPMSQLEVAKQHHRQLLANCLAQAQALSKGQASDDPNEVCPGGRPSNLIWVPKLDAFNLGSLLALYEHRTFCLGALWDINSFDQPAVELGKRLAKPIEAALASPNQSELINALDDITAQRVQTIIQHKQ